MFLRSYANLRAAEIERKRAKAQTEAGILRTDSLQVLAHLGPGAFSEITGEAVNCVLSVWSRHEPGDDQRFTAFRLVSLSGPDEKIAYLREAKRGALTAFRFTPPQAAAITFVRYHLDINSTDLTERLRKEKSVLIVPGDHFGMDHFVRISFGLPHDYLTAALDRVHELIEELKA